MPIHQLPIGPLESNTYIVENGKDAVIFDPSDMYEPIMELLNIKKLDVKAIICTHLHYDHISGVSKLHELTKAPIYAGAADLELKEIFFGRSMSFGMPPTIPFDAEALVEGETKYGSLNCTQLATPGHSPGGFCFYFPKENAVITGDTLFKRSIGRSDLPGGNPATLIKSIKDKLMTLPEETLVYPGHEKSSTIKSEKENNPYLKHI